MRKTICLIQARLTSKRFKNKIFKKIHNLTIIEILYERLKNSKYIDETVFLIPENYSNKALADLLLDKQIPFFSGSEKNVFSRYYEFSKRFNPKVIVRITADCPLIDGKLIDLYLKEFVKFRYRYLCSRDGENPLPDGLDVEVFKPEILYEIKKKFLNRYDLEHVTPAIRKLIVPKKSLKYKFKFNIKEKYSIDNYFNFIKVKKVFMKQKSIKFSLHKTLKILSDYEKRK